MQSPTTWFSKTDAAPSVTPATSTSTISNAGKGIAGQFKSMGTAVTSAVGKAKNAVTSTFTSDGESGDATSLGNLPKTLNPEVYVANGQLFEAQGNYAKALDNYTRALEREPSNESALLSTARLYSRQQQDEQAIEFFQKAIAANPNNAATQNELAVLYQGQGKNAEAQLAIQKAIAIDPANPRYHNNLAGMLVKVGRSDDAVRQLEQVFEPAVANYNVAFLHFSNKNLAGAQQHLEVALRADPNLQEARTLMERIGGSNVGRTATVAYNSAGQIYRTAQAVAGGSQFGNANYSQRPAAGPVAQTASLPTAQTFNPAANSIVPQNLSVGPGQALPTVPQVPASSASYAVPLPSLPLPVFPQPATAGTPPQSPTALDFPAGMPAVPATGPGPSGILPPPAQNRY